MNEGTRYYARVPRGVLPAMAHTWPERRMPPARALLIAPAGGGYAVVRWDARGDAAGRTAHRCLDDALDQIAWEFLGEVDDWREIPATVSEAEIAGWVLDDRDLAA